MSYWSLRQIAEWFIERHSEWVKDNKLVSWAEKLGIKLNVDGKLDEGQLFQLFVLAILWNNKPTHIVERGEKVFEEIKNEYTLENFQRATRDKDMSKRLKETASEKIQNEQIYELLNFIANGTLNGKSVWAAIKELLEFPIIGNEEDDLKRLKDLYELFNAPYRNWKAYFTVKTFLIFREIRIQFRKAGKYQYNPVICCIPDSNVRKALNSLDLLDEVGNDLNNMIKASRLMANTFCTEKYDLYDLPLFFWYKEKRANILQ